MGAWDPQKFTVEDSAFGFMTMENGATIILESSWALNTLDIDEAKCSLSGTEGGADMKDCLRINGEKFGQLYTTNVELGDGGVAFYDGKVERDSDLESRLWIECIINDTEPIVCCNTNLRSNLSIRQNRKGCLFGFIFRKVGLE